MERRFLGILAGLVLIFVGIAVFGGGSKDNNSNKPGTSSEATSHIEGQGSKQVTLVEYGDYQCPVCLVYYPVIKDVFAKYQQDIYFQFRNLPLVSSHPNAFSAARAAEAADLQGKFWEMNDMLFQNHDSWASSSNPLSLFVQYAQKISLNTDQFKKDFASSVANDRINADLAEFKKTGQAQATPTFFLDGKVLDNKSLSDPKTGIPSVDKFSQIIDAEIAQKSKQ